MLTPELASLICKIDLSTPEKVAAFKAWQFDDGTLEGLQKLYEAQQSVHADPPSACEDCGSVDEHIHYVNCPLANTAGK